MHKGKSPVYVTVVTDKGMRVSAVADRNLTVRPDVEFCRKMEQLVGRGKFRSVTVKFNRSLMQFRLL